MHGILFTEAKSGPILIRLFLLVFVCFISVAFVMFDVLNKNIAKKIT